MIGNIIKEERIKKNITQEDLANQIGVSPSTIGMYEQNRRQPDNETLVKLSNFFNVTIDYILGKTAFRNRKELLEQWGHRGENFDPVFDFGGLLQAKREELNISQQYIADKLNITISDVDDIEEGVLPLNIEWAKKFADLLNTTIEQLFEENPWAGIPTNQLYYLNEDTKQIAQEIFNNKELRALFDASKGATQEDLEITKNLLLSLKNKEKRGNGVD